MKVATKALVTLLIVTALTLSTTGGAVAVADSKNNSRSNQLERLQRRHDRKLELRASVLGITPVQLKQELKETNFDRVLKKYGFKNRASFYTAVAGKAKDELKRRGWSENKINHFLQKRSDRLLGKH